MAGSGSWSTPESLPADLPVGMKLSSMGNEEERREEKRRGEGGGEKKRNNAKANTKNPKDAPDWQRCVTSGTSAFYFESGRLEFCLVWC